MAGLYRGKVQDGCEINYMQSKKYPNSSEKVYPNNNVSNKGLLKNPYNNISEPIAKPGQRPLRITTDMWGNVYARSDTMLVPGVTNSNLLKNPFNNLSEPVPEKKILSNQKIKDINNKLLPNYMLKNKGVSELAMKCLLMINNKHVKLLTISLMKYLVTKKVDDVRIAGDAQKILSALNIYSQLIDNAKKIYMDFGNDESQLADALKPFIMQYEAQLIHLLPFLGNPIRDDAAMNVEISQSLAELAALSNALSRLFDQDKSISSSTTLSMNDIIAQGGIPPNAVPPTPIVPVAGAGAAGAVQPTAQGLNSSAAAQVGGPFIPIVNRRPRSASVDLGGTKPKYAKTRAPIGVLAGSTTQAQQPPPSTGPPLDPSAGPQLDPSTGQPKQGWTWRQLQDKMDELNTGYAGMYDDTTQFGKWLGMSIKQQNDDGSSNNYFTQNIYDKVMNFAKLKMKNEKNIGDEFDNSVDPPDAVASKIANDAFIELHNEYRALDAYLQTEYTNASVSSGDPKSFFFQPKKGTIRQRLAKTSGKPVIPGSGRHHKAKLLNQTKAMSYQIY
jgi:hypothetical protein